MTVYAIAQLKIHNPERYSKYFAGFMATLEGIDCTPLANDENPAVLEGEWHADKVLLLAFKDAENFQKWASSDAYQAIVQDRRASSDGTVLLVQGLS
ncbi:DUF1330 domain-containing protein [Kordiimonas sp.]|uniref:DUF1330 domain-containing protein n=1 Tax=Kordiimonas sp. TaxID=1970157 RepID=UPI003A9263CA